MGALRAGRATSGSEKTSESVGFFGFESFPYLRAFAGGTLFGPSESKASSASSQSD